MKCVVDGCDGNLQVKHSYHRRNCEITRRRVCDKCGYVYNTVEVDRDQYDVDKILVNDLRKALIRHRDKRRMLKLVED